MREDEVVAARLRSVLAATTSDVRDQAATADSRRTVPLKPAGGSRFTTALGDLAEVGDPLRWSDIIPAWPDDMDLDPLPSSPAPPTDGYPPGTPWASPPTHPAPPSFPALPSLPALTGDQMEQAEPPYRPAPLPPPAWVMAEPAEYEPWPESEPESDPDPDPPALTAAGAFDGGKRFGIGAFDPGRRGVKALAAVAVVVLVLAAFFAWRARPRVDNVAPPSFETPTAASSGQGGSKPTPAELVVAVGGKVRRPGLVRLEPGARVADALAAAGGSDPGVDVATLNLARKVVDGELILVGVTPAPGVAPAATTGTGTGAPAGGPINLNTATLADLDTLPGVGPVLAQRILDARDAQGGFGSVADLRKVDGIGDARYEQLKDLVTV